jgi:signal transduction histidine kinase
MRLESQYTGLDLADGLREAWKASESAQNTTDGSERAHGWAATVDVFQELINGLPEQIALLDSDWNVLTVNEAWRHTATMYGFHDLTPGSNYREFLGRMAREGHPSAAAVSVGIDEIAAGKRDSFRLVYSGSGAWEGHEFQLRMNLIDLGGHRFATVTRYDVTELVQLRRMREGFSSSVIKSQDEERRRMGRELHDSTMQLLASLGLALGQLKRSSHPEAASGVISEMEQLLVEAQGELRSISYLAHPPQLEKMSLFEAIRMLVEGFGRRAGLKTEFSVEGVSKLSSTAAEVALYRVIQEALSNVHRHARATELTVKLIGRRQMIHAVVVDNGVGIPDHVLEGVGLAGMHSRLSEVGGRLFVRHASKGSGTMILASLPPLAHLRAIGDLAVAV